MYNKYHRIVFWLLTPIILSASIVLCTSTVLYSEGEKERNISQLSETIISAKDMPIQKSIKNPSDKIIALSKTLNMQGLSELLAQCDNLEMQEKVFGIVLKYYPKYISKIEWRNSDVVFTVRDTEIWYANGKMLNAASMNNKAKYRGILYPYSINLLEDVYQGLPIPRKEFSSDYVRSSDFQIALAGGSPDQIESFIQEYRLLGLRVRLHPVAAYYAELVSSDLLAMAETDKEVRAFIDGIKTISGFKNRKVGKSSNISMHAFGFAMDIIPYTYDGKVTYWQWTEVLYPDEWATMPLSRRWLVSEKIVDVFEKHGFIWGGKWPHYDTIHFEFRPELIGYAEARLITGTIGDWDTKKAKEIL